MKGIEVFFECLQFHARTLEGGLNDANLLVAAHEVRKCCDFHGITVMTLQPFIFFGGLTESLAHAEAIESLRLWFQLVRVLGTELIQIPTNFLPQKTTGDHNRIIADMTEVATMGMKQEPPIRFAYEAVAWGTHIDTWDGTWDIVKAVNMPNFGLCLDTFHIAGKVWGDPTAISGRNVNGPDELAMSMAKMIAELDVNKIFYVQVGDAELLYPPCYRGWLSLESFNRDLFSERNDLTSEYAGRAEASWNTLNEKILQMK
ncbi:hypothetical protein B0A49_10858 [Cryomyces minteri]|uniref:Xylose isomerase-like TIM barrel domain-containing protein n=1 Tax=Cryomyces minteri TaxID=331657 RepID=A0A4U0W2S8_9PEZI|nr:hypothetical protein B0A49_10858 [Cryomyces minteri]